MDRIAKLLEHLPEMLRRDAAGEPPLFPPADPLQRPRFYIPDLTAQPWHDPKTLPWMQRFVDAYDVIRAELDAFLAQQRIQFRDYVGPILHERADAGEWHVLYLRYRDHRWDGNCRMFPRMMSLVDAIPRRSGTVFISRLTPGAHIPAHCGATNTQLTCHFGIVVPDGVELRVARETRTQRQGECTVFDDSFEHEVWNRAATPRYNLFLQCWHPDLSDDDIAGIRKIEQLPQIQATIAEYLEGTSAMEPVGN
jgi:aspartate beta-hydroxylase